MTSFHSNVAPPGYYLLFVLVNGVPSVAPFLRLGYRTSLVWGPNGADAAVSGNGIYLNSTKNPTFKHMNLHDFQNYALVGTTVNDFTMDYCIINGANGTLQSGIGEGSVYFTGLTTSASVTNSDFSGGAYDTFHVFNTAGQSLNRITITNCSFAMTNTLGSDA